MREEEMMASRTYLRYLVPCVIGAAFACAGMVTAGALTDGVAAFAGSGTTSPGLTLTPTAQSVGGGGTLAGAALVGTTPVAIADTCSYSGSTDIQSTLVQSDGNISASCGGTAAVSALLHYTRTGPVVVVQGSGTVNGASVLVNAACVFVPTSGPTVTSYALACALVASDTI